MVFSPSLAGQRHIMLVKYILESAVTPKSFTCQREAFSPLSSLVFTAPLIAALSACANSNGSRILFGMLQMCAQNKQNCHGIVVIALFSPPGSSVGWWAWIADGAQGLFLCSGLPQHSLSAHKHHKQQPAGCWTDLEGWEKYMEMNMKERNTLRQDEKKNQSSWADVLIKHFAKCSGRPVSTLWDFIVVHCSKLQVWVQYEQLWRL